MQSFLATAAAYYEGRTGIHLKASRLTQLTGGFKNLLTTELRTIKCLAAYAARLNVSESYLNEALKKTTGLTVSYWIQQEVMMEAKRLLYYSGLTVKEIAQITILLLCNNYHHLVSLSSIYFQSIKKH